MLSVSSQPKSLNKLALEQHLSRERHVAFMIRLEKLFSENIVKVVVLICIDMSDEYKSVTVHASREPYRIHYYQLKRPPFTIAKSV
jgi:hypothetical protein